MTVPMAGGGPAPLWPLPDDPVQLNIRESRRFGAARDGSDRYHAAIDLGSERGRRVVAPEAGRVVRVQTFYTTKAGIPTWAVLLALDSGPVVLLGELEPTTIAVERGQRVQAGGLVGHVGATNMLHLGTLAPGSTSTVRWYRGDPPPPTLTDPTDWVSRMVAGPVIGPMPIPWRPHLPDWLPRPVPPPPPYPGPAPGPAPARADGGGALLAVAALAVLAWGWS